MCLKLNNIPSNLLYKKTYFKKSLQYARYKNGLAFYMAKGGSTILFIKDVKVCLLKYLK